MELPGTKTLSLVPMLDCNVMFSSNVSPCLKEKREQGGEGCLKRTGERVCTHRERERER